jgi:hypothetical protein
MNYCYCIEIKPDKSHNLVTLDVHADHRYTLDPRATDKTYKINKNTNLIFIELV